ncbi:hypothetical protein QJQ45_020152 [Haematococcus lacustris]|nr:hypothetical protein QJQ45_020152 [Haematococcus lacustris]
MADADEPEQMFNRVMLPSSEVLRRCQKSKHAGDWLFQCNSKGHVVAVCKRCPKILSVGNMSQTVPFAFVNNVHLQSIFQLLGVDVLKEKHYRTEVLDELYKEVKQATLKELRELVEALDEATLEALKVPTPRDFYELLGFDIDFENPVRGSLAPGALEVEDIKAAYRRLQKYTHPDIAGGGQGVKGGEAATGLAALLNLAYTTLTDPHAREAYTVELRSYRKGAGNYTGQPESVWAGPAGEDRAIFVDETSCQVSTQWGDDEEEVLDAVGSCPVDCIHFVERKELPVLEYVSKSCKRENIAVMARRRSGNMGSAPTNESPFARAELFVRVRRDAKVDEVRSEQVAAGGVARLHDEALSAAIAKAWLALPQNTKAKAWPRWAAAAQQSYDEAAAEQREQELLNANASSYLSSVDSMSSWSEAETTAPQSSPLPAIPTRFKVGI